MHAFADEAVFRVSTAAAHVLSKKSEAVSVRSAAALAAGLLRYGPRAALTAYVLGAVWLVGSYFVGPASRTVVQQESVQNAEEGHAAQKTAEDPHAQKADVEAMGTAQSLSTKDATDPGNTKPRLDAAKSETSAAIAEVSGKGGRLRPKSPEKFSKVNKRLDRIGLEIATLLAANSSRRSLGIGSAGPRKRHNAGTATLERIKD